MATHFFRHTVTQTIKGVMDWNGLCVSIILRIDLLDLTVLESSVDLEI